MSKEMDLFIVGNNQRTHKKVSMCICSFMCLHKRKNWRKNVSTIARRGTSNSTQWTCISQRSKKTITKKFRHTIREYNYMILNKLVNWWLSTNLVKVKKRIMFVTKLFISTFKDLLINDLVVRTHKYKKL